MPHPGPDQLALAALPGEPVVAAATGLAAGLVIAVGAAAPPPAPVPLAQVTLVPLATTDPRPSGTATVTEADGVREIAVDVTEPAPAGSYLQAWLIDEDATRLYSLGTLTREPDGTHFRGTFRLPPNLSLTAFNTLDVSAEPFDGDPGHSGKSLLRYSTI